MVVGPMRQESSTVDRLYSDFSLLIENIDISELSLRSAAEEIFQKSLYVAIGSYFEQRITAYIVEFMAEASGGNVLVTEFTRIKGVSRQYHTFFEWGGRNANRFFAMFGSDFRAHMVQYVRGNPEFADAISAFLEVGNMRNEVAHDFGSVALTKTVQEIYQSYRQALTFVDEIPLRLGEFEQNGRVVPNS